MGNLVYKPSPDIVQEGYRVTVNGAGRGWPLGTKKAARRRLKAVPSSDNQFFFVSLA